MMFFKDFLQWVRSSGERYVVLDVDGEPEFVIEPFGKKQKKSSIEIINDTIADVAKKERQEVAGWDAMAERTLGVDPTPSVAVDGSAQPHDEPQFQFETIDE